MKRQAERSIYTKYLVTNINLFKKEASLNEAKSHRDAFHYKKNFDKLFNF